MRQPVRTASPARLGPVSVFLNAGDYFGPPHDKRAALRSSRPCLTGQSGRLGQLGARGRARHAQHHRERVALLRWTGSLSASLAAASLLGRTVRPEV